MHHSYAEQNILNTGSEVSVHFLYWLIVNVDSVWFVIFLHTDTTDRWTSDRQQAAKTGPPAIIFGPRT